jgi:peptidylprolyl isomerase
MIRALILATALLAAAPALAQKLPAGVDPANTVLLDTKDGRVVIKLRTDIAPKHAERIKLLIREKFYDDVAFHRVIAGFMAQTGDGEFGKVVSGSKHSDPSADSNNVPSRRGKVPGTGNSKHPNLQAEFSNVPFKRGVVGMARKGNDVNSANSQFFIMFDEAPSLNGQYTVIGEVLSGMDVVDRIKKGNEAAGGAVTDPDRIVRIQVAADAK